ncbi:hypothetical protein BGZ76_011485 [Entomortierella beljakovae]|nr:hypothetical protein BGZ76_011485 [Entomortierella beljakovae]
MSSTHKFREKTYTRLTYCDYCTKLLWGVAKQGVTCEGCGFNCHRKCSELVYANCVKSMHIPSPDELKRSATMGSSEISVGQSTGANSGLKKGAKVPPRRALSENMRVSIPPAVVSSSQPLQSLVEKPPVSAIPTQKPIKSSFLEEAIISAAIRMSLPADISELPQNDHPALSIQATTVNFTRFVHKSTGLFWVQDRVEDILTWKDPWNTTFVLVLYCFVCIYPILLFLLPQSIMAAIMIYFFQQKSARQQKKILRIKSGPVVLQPIDEDYNNDLKPHSGNDEDYLEHNSSSESEKDERERQSRAVQYLSNLQHIQNMMGDVSEAHDVIRPLFNHLDWSDESEAIIIVQVTVFAFIAMSLGMWFIPWRWVFMVGGASGFMITSPWGKVVIKECKPLVLDIVQWAQLKAKTPL